MFQDFLSLDESKLKDKLQDAEKSLKVDTVEQLYTMEGKANLSINEPTKKYTRLVGEYTKSADALYQK